MHDDFFRSDWTQIADKQPPRQGFYRVCLTDGKAVVAEWRKRDKQGPRWWIHLSDDPTVEKTAHPLDGVKSWAKASKEAVAQALVREPTVEERIERAYQALLSTERLYPAYTPLPPERRQLRVGDAIEFGSLKDCQVVDLREEGRVVVFSCQSVRQRRDTDEPARTEYRAASWLEVLGQRQFEAQTQQFVQRSPLDSAFSTRSLSSLVHLVMCGLDDQPDFQRGYVWTEEDAQAYLDTVMAGRDLGRFVIVSREYPHNDWLLDGKQRLNCLMRFYRSELSWRGVYWDQLTRRDRRTIEDRMVSVAQLHEKRYTRADLLRIFLEVNTRGVPQSEEHLAKVRALLAQEEAL